MADGTKVELHVQGRDYITRKEASKTGKLTHLFCYDYLLGEINPRMPQE
jgi:hypothetical protein